MKFEMKSWKKRAILTGCLLGIFGIMGIVWVFAPLLFYGWIALMVILTLVGYIQNRKMINAQIKVAIEEWRLKNSQDSNPEQKD